MVQKAQDPKEKEENAIYIPVILNGLLTDGNNVLILVVLKVKVMGVESFNLCYHSTAPAQRVLLKILTRKPWHTSPFLLKRSDFRTVFFEKIAWAPSEVAEVKESRMVKEQDFEAEKF